MIVPEDLPIAVTAMSPLPFHRRRQAACLRTWLDAGLRVVAVNTSAEIATLAGELDGVDEWIASDDTADGLQFIHSLADVAVRKRRSVLIINSDIAIQGDVAMLTHACAPRTLTVGIRHNHPPESSTAGAQRERWGLDAFFLTVEMAASLPRLPLTIGRPVWDYWLPLHFRGLGYSVAAIGQPFFFHEEHPQYWTQADWIARASLVDREYGSNLVSMAREFRSSLPYPPDVTDDDLARRRLLFHHVPKCGGVSILTWLRDNYPAKMRFCVDGNRTAESLQEFARSNEWQRHRRLLIAGHEARELLSLVHPDTKSATVLRNPVDRVLSWYYYAKSATHPSMHQVHELCSSRALEAILRERTEAALSLRDRRSAGGAATFTNWMTAHFARMNHVDVALRPEYALQRAKQAIDSFDIVGVLERLPEFAARLKLPVAFDGRKLNRSIRPSMQDVPRRLVRSIEAANGLDAELYDFAASVSRRTI